MKSPTERLTTAFRALADALEGNGRHPLPCSDPEMPARRILEMCDDLSWDLAALVGAVVNGKDALDALCDEGLCDE